MLDEHLKTGELTTHIHTHKNVMCKGISNKKFTHNGENTQSPHIQGRDKPIICITKINEELMLYFSSLHNANYLNCETLPVLAMKPTCETDKSLQGWSMHHPSSLQLA